MRTVLWQTKIAVTPVAWIAFCIKAQPIPRLYENRPVHRRENPAHKKAAVAQQFVTGLGFGATLAS
jgi:hypothetical protein